MKDQLDRHDKMQRLNNRPISLQEQEDNEQISYLNQWKIDHPETDLAGYILLVLVAIAAIVAIKLYINLHKPVPMLKAAHATCLVCHFPEAAKYKKVAQYKAGLRKPLTVRPVDLADLTR